MQLHKELTGKLKLFQSKQEESQAILSNATKVPCSSFPAQSSGVLVCVVNKWIPNVSIICPKMLLNNTHTYRHSDISLSLSKGICLYKVTNIYTQRYKQTFSKTHKYIWLTAEQLGGLSVYHLLILSAPPRQRTLLTVNSISCSTRIV